MTRKVKSSNRIFTEDEFRQLIKFVESTPENIADDDPNIAITTRFIKIRDAALFKLLYFTGLRPLEGISLKWEDIDFEKKLIYLKPISNKERNVTPGCLTEPAMAVLKQYEKQLEILGLKLPYIFYNGRTKRPVTVSAMGKRLNVYIYRCGLGRVDFYDSRGKPFHSFSLYSFRHTFGSKVYEITGDSEAVTIALRHKRPESAHCYIHLDHTRRQAICDAVFQQPKRKENDLPMKHGKTQIINVMNQEQLNNKLIMQFMLQQQQTNELLVKALAELTKQKGGAKDGLDKTD